MKHVQTKIDENVSHRSRHYTDLHTSLISLHICMAHIITRTFKAGLLDHLNPKGIVHEIMVLKKKYYNYGTTHVHIKEHEIKRSKSQA
jgi:hypothetical protein